MVQPSHVWIFPNGATHNECHRLSVCAVTIMPLIDLQLINLINPITASIKPVANSQIEVFRNSLAVTAAILESANHAFSVV